MKIKYILCLMSIGLVLLSVHDHDYYLAFMGCFCLLGSVFYDG